jgi:cell wall-associated NlpC family hydrolase
MVFRQGDVVARTPRGRRVLLCVAAVVVTVLCCASPVVATPPPSNPTNGQLSSAAQAKNALAASVGRLQALVAQAANKLQQLTSTAELAEQKYALAISKLEQAKEQAVAAQAAIVAAQKQLLQARAALTSFVRSTYLSPTIGGGAGNLLTARDPNALLERGDYIQFVSARHLDAMTGLDRATIAKSNADARAKALVQLQAKLTAEAQAARNVAAEAVRQEKLQQAALQTQQAAYQVQLQTAQMRLAVLNNQRAQFVAYQAEQARIAAEKAREAALQRQAAAAAAAAAAARNNSGGGGGGGGGSIPIVSSGGCTSGTAGQRAVCWAEKWLGTPYAWAGGNASGPTYGINSPGTDGWNDSHVYGFDCSGLTLYAWAHEGLYLDHYAASQFSQAGSFHPSPGNYQPGDLLFWGLPGQASIHHVAMYVGGGNVIQAPNSGSYVQITPWQQVSGDYFGATRPGT